MTVRSSVWTASVKALVISTLLVTALVATNFCFRRQRPESNTHRFALRGWSQTACSHRNLLEFSNRPSDFGNFGGNFGAGDFSSFSNSTSNGDASGGGNGVGNSAGGSVGWGVVNGEIVVTTSGNVTTNPEGDVFYFPNGNFTIGEGFGLVFQTNWRKKRWRKQRRKQWRSEQE